jgi:lipoprotein signal peptidase
MADEKRVYDPRGKMVSLTRLTGFDREAFYHLLSYRAFIIFSLITFVVFILSLAMDSLTEVWRVLLVVVWLLMTSQVYESVKAFALVGSNGRAFGHLNESFMSSMMRKEEGKRWLEKLPYVVLVLWLLGFVIFAAEMI